MTDKPISHDFVYVHTDIPPGMTISEWRAHHAPQTTKARARIRRVGRGGMRPMLAAAVRRVAAPFTLTLDTFRRHEPRLHHTLEPTADRDRASAGATGI
jgi:hypothetical protein